ncbi:hypothetical protein A2Y85_01655 [candidate division WOR-3 bacterium RBG_13_43_14]|uniref:Outer membrane protein beta-barrel domain-containing protein n=1 Tax=candidate division WOR-3 bacterium RBG_13_43_14 TaxID=1802590 RepID=A0A1F4U1Y9_UNCW3|nr:MAG: hypothetical protein A2Y85_01655 [candidate division WOR-3 bacterium RBG_13_43_14]
MKKLFIFFIIITTTAFAGCLDSPISTRVGIRTGLTISNYDPDSSVSSDEYSGTGMLLGLGMGSDFFSILAIDMTPQYRSTSHARDEILGRRTYSYNNLYFPITLSLKGGMIPFVSPYVSVGIGINVPLSGIERFEYNNGTAIENEIGGSVGGFAILGVGAEVKLLKFRIVPEFMANMQGYDDQTVKTTDYHLSIGFYYAP